MGFSIYVDWSEEWKNPDKWINHGRYALEQGCKHHTKSKDNTNMEYAGYCDECGTSEDSAQPMMNYVYPLELTDFDEEKILRVVNETNCTVMENQDTGEWFLALCGGGMDLSQDIAYAYLILERWIPKDLLGSVCKQAGLNIGMKKWKELAAAMVEQLNDHSDRFELDAKSWEDRIKAQEIKDEK